MKKKKIDMPIFREEVHPALKEVFGYRLMYAALKYRKSLLVILGDFKITPPQMAILKMLEVSDLMNQVNIGGELEFDKVSIVRMIDGLQELELVKRIQGTEDKREKIIQITKKGRKVIAEIEKRKILREKNFLAPLTSAEAETLKKLIMKL